MDIGTPELIVVLVIVILIFGVGRLAKLGAEAGQALREFRRGLAGPDAPEPTETRSAQNELAKSAKDQLPLGG